MALCRERRFLGHAIDASRYFAAISLGAAKCLPERHDDIFKCYATMSPLFLLIKRIPLLADEHFVGGL